MVYYRKYRPQTIEELDSERVKDALKASLSKTSIPHAFLFTGPKGLGKTSTARIVAKIINCERLVDKRLASSSKGKKLNAENYTLNANIEPCNKCGECKSTTNGTNFDVIEIDAASNRGIDEIRDLKEKINLSTAGAFKKVYIIDEVHMLTQEAFNALLKTLEEPPSHVVFILCTTELQKLPATIVSRCFQIQFKKATEEELIRSFKRIVKAEKILISDEALIAIAKLSDGSFRDGVKILEEIASKSGVKEISKEFIEKEYQTSGIESRISDLLKALKNKDTKEALVLISKSVEEGTDVKFFLEILISRFHSMLLAQINGEKIENEFSFSEIKSLIELLLKASSQAKYAILPQLPLELAIVEYCSVVWGPVSVFPPASAPSATPRSNSVRAVGNPSISPSLAVEPLRAVAQASVSRVTPHDGFLEELILKVNAENHIVAGLLRGVALKSSDGGKVVIETKFKFHKEKLEDKNAMDLLIKEASEILGKNVTIKIELKEEVKILNE